MPTSKKTFEKNTEAQVNAVNIKTLSDRPNVVSRYGDGGLSATQLKERFDGFPALNREKINQIIDILNGPESTKYLGIGTVETDALSEFGVDNLYDLLVKMTTSDIADVLKVDYETAADAEARPYTLQQAISDIIDVNSKQHAAIMGNTGRIESLESDNGTNKSDISGHESRIKALESDNGTNKSNISGHESRIKALESWKEPTNAQVIKNVNSLVDHLDRINVLEEDNTSNKNRISTLETDNTINKSNISANASKISTLETAYQSLAGVDETVIANITTIDEKLTAAQTKVDDHIEAANKTIAGIKDKVDGVFQDGTIKSDSIIIGEGEAAEYSIAGGTTDIDTYGKKAGLTTTEILALKAALALSGGVKESKATAPLSIALGANNESTSSGAISLGYGNTNSGFNSTAIGAMNTVSGDSSLAYGYKNTVNGDFSTVVGQENTVGEMGFAGGVLSEATGTGSISYGNENVASGEYAVALGGDNTASGKRSVALGNENEASGECSFAEGTNTTASGKYSHAQNEETTASGESSTAMGYRTEASGNQAFAGGRETVASARNSTALGFQTEASHEQSFTTGRNLITGRTNQTVIGEFNKKDSNALLVIGVGNSDSDRKNALVVHKDGSVYVGDEKVLTAEQWRVTDVGETGLLTFDPGENLGDYEFAAQFTVNGNPHRVMLGILHFGEGDLSGTITGSLSAPVETNSQLFLQYNIETKELKCLVVVRGQETFNRMNNYALYYRLVHG